MIIESNIVDIGHRRTFFGQLEVENARILNVVEVSEEQSNVPYVLPGFVDAHVHIESSMLVPSEFARLAISHGTLATVSDPHEIANVMGMEGVNYMIKHARNLPFHICYGAPSCVPATEFETAGAKLDAEDVRQLMELPEVGYLSEMMNYPGVLYGDEEVLKKIEIAKQLELPVDGHAPGLKGDEARRYIDAGISTDHECYTIDEAIFKIENGMKIIIREGSAAKNFEALWPLIDSFPDQVMLCSDDKHPDDLVLGHINQLAERAISKGCDLYHVLKVACTNAVAHYQLPIGQLNVGDDADFIVVKDLKTFLPLASYWKGNLVAKNGKALFKYVYAPVINKFDSHEKSPSEFQLSADPEKEKVQVIEAIDGELITKSFTTQLEVKNGLLQTSVDRDILLIAVVNRYFDAPPALGFIHGFGLQKGAIASSVAHDSHNIVAVGVDADQVCMAVNQIIRTRGGVCAVSHDETHVLPLPVAGIMSNEPAEIVARGYQKVDQYSKEILGSKLRAPLMTLSFMALLVIPSLKMSDLGLFDGTLFRFTPVQ
jgi:adenine deaminase